MTTPIRTINLNDLELYRQLAELAQQNDRSTAAEARVAIRRHLEGNKPLRLPTDYWPLTTERTP